MPQKCELGRIEGPKQGNQCPGEGQHNMSRYHEVYKSWQNDSEGFWSDAAQEIDWFTDWDKVFDPYAGQYGRWFAGATCNTCYNCVDRHVETRGDQAAIIYDSPITGKKRTFTYRELQHG